MDKQAQTGDGERGKKNEAQAIALSLVIRRSLCSWKRHFSKGVESKAQVKSRGASQQLLCSSVGGGNGEKEGGSREAVVLVFERTEKV